MRVQTVGIWRVKPGREDEFVAAWKEMAGWTQREIPGAIEGTLLRDRDEPTRFISVGPWESVEAIDAWRATAGFQERVGKVRELLDEFTPITLDEVASSLES